MVYTQTPTYIMYYESRTLGCNEKWQIAKLYFPQDK